MLGPALTKATTLNDGKILNLHKKNHDLNEIATNVKLCLSIIVLTGAWNKLMRNWKVLLMDFYSVL